MSSAVNRITVSWIRRLQLQCAVSEVQDGSNQLVGVFNVQFYRTVASPYAQTGKNRVDLTTKIALNTKHTPT